MNPVLQFDPERLLWEGLAPQHTDAERPPTEMLTRRKPQTGPAQGSSMHRRRDLSVCLLPAPCLSGEAGPDSPLEAAECPSLASLQPPPLHLQPVSPGHLASAGHLPPACWRACVPGQGERVDRLSLAWACRAETPASSSRRRGQHCTCAHSAARGVQLAAAQQGDRWSPDFVWASVSPSAG